MPIRTASISDAPALSSLSAELGYPVPEETMAERIRQLDSGHAVFVATAADGHVVGWIDVGTVFHLQTGSRAEIGGLVVEPAFRSQGAGRELVLRVEQWARERGLKKLVVRSNTRRTEAHRFYLRENYTHTKTSAVFEKHL